MSRGFVSDYQPAERQPNERNAAILDGNG